MKKNIYISVSTDPIKSYQEIVEYAKEIQPYSDFLHCDIMDGDFVSKETYDSNLVKSINANCALPLDVHLMVNEPLKEIKKYIDSGANILTIHYEAFEDKNQIVEALNLIRENHALAGLSLKPETPFKEIKPYCFDIDVVLVMSVEPGASGQKFLPSIYKKIKEIDSFRRENNLKFKIEIDGGVNSENIKMLAEFGVDIVVSGNFVYKDDNHKRAIEELRVNA